MNCIRIKKLKVQIDNLDPQKEYVLTVTYQNILLSKHVNICLYAGEEFIHDCIERNCKSDRKLDPCYSYLLPQNSYAEGTLELTWRSIHSLGPCTVCELWIREKENNLLLIDEK